MREKITCNLHCKFCNSTNIVHYGCFRGIQRWWCKDCRRKFAQNDALPNMKTPTAPIATALSLYYNGTSLNNIQKIIDQKYGFYLSDSTIYNWILRFTALAIANTSTNVPCLGDIWVANEFQLKIGGHNIWFWDVIDTRTRFLITSYMSMAHTLEDARILIEQAVSRSEKCSGVVICINKPQDFLKKVGFSRSIKSSRLDVIGSSYQPIFTIVEPYVTPLEDRTNVIRKLKTLNSTELTLSGWQVHYNYLRPGNRLGDITPAEKAGLYNTITNWLDVINQLNGKTSTTTIV